MTEENDNPDNPGQPAGGGQGNGGGEPAPAPTNEPTVAELQQQLDDANRGRQADVAALVESTREQHPNIPPELIAGNTADEVRASVDAAQRTVDQVIERNKPPAQPGGAGSPPRPEAAPTAPPEGTTGADRIRFGLRAQQEER